MRTQSWSSDWMPHALLVAGLTAIATFGLSDRSSESRWFYWAVRGVGCVAAIEAYREYRKRAPIPVDIMQAELRADLAAASTMQIAAIERQYQGEVARLNQLVQSITLQLQEERHRLQLSAWASEQWLQEQNANLEANRQALQVAYNDAVAQAEAKLETQRQNLMQQLDGLWQNLQDKARAEVQKLQADVQFRDKVIAEMRNELARLQQVKFATGTTRVEWIANEVVELFWALEVPVDYVDSTTVNNVDIIWLKPREIIDGRKVKDTCSVVAEQIDGIQGVSSKVEGGVIVLELKTLPEKQNSRDTQPLTIEGYDYFKKAIGKSNHDLVNGGTGAGKSTLISNLIDAASSDLKEEIAKNRAGWNIEVLPDVAVYISDPKFPRTEWYLNGQRVKPQYRGFERWTDPNGVEHPSALDGYAAMDAEVRARLNRAMLADFYGKPSAEQPAIFVLDEAEQLIALDKKEASEPVLFATRVGRSELIRAVVIGQSTNCSAYGLQKPNLYNFTRWFLGDTIDKGIEEVCYTTVQKRKYREELNRLQQIALTDKTRQFFALVKFPNERPCFVYLPPPGYFATQTYKPADLDQAIELPELQLSEEDKAMANLSIDQLKELAAETNLLDGDARDKLEAAWAKAEEVLPAHLRIIVDYALKLKGQWVTVGKLRANRNQFKDASNVPEPLILQYFQELTDRGLGELSPDGRKYRYEGQ